MVFDKLLSLNAIEIIALLFVVLALVKIITISVKRKSWFEGVVKPLYSTPKLTAFFFTIIAAIILYYLIQTLSIVQIFAVIAFSAFLIGLGFLLYSKELMPSIKKLYNKKLSGWFWVQVLIWLGLSVWVLYEIFAA